MVIAVSPTEGQPTHHLKLSDGTNEIGLILCNADGTANPRIARDPMPRSSIKMYSGAGGIADMEPPPWTPIAQDDFSGGMLNERLEAAADKYYWGAGVNTMKPGELSLGPLETPTLLDDGVRCWPDYDSLGTDVEYNPVVFSLDKRVIEATPFTPSTTFIPTKLKLVYAWHGSPTIEVAIREDSAGTNHPGAVLFTAVSERTPWCPEEDVLDSVTWTFDNGVALSAGTKYWLAITMSYDSSNYITLLNIQQGSRYSCRWSLTDGATWGGGASMAPAFVLSAGTYDHEFTKTFVYKSSMYALTKNGQLFRNGYQGVAKNTSTTTRIYANIAPGWTNDEWIGAVAILVDGTGSTQRVNSRVITDSGSDWIEMSAWEVAPGADTVFSIVGSDKWATVTNSSGSLPTDVYDVLVWGGNIWVAQGDSLDIKLMYCHNVAGAWHLECAAQTGHRGRFLIAQPDSEITRLVYFKRSGLAHWETMPAEGASLPAYTSTPEKQVGDPLDWVNSVTLYDEDQAIWVFKGSSPYILKATGSLADGDFNYYPYKFKLNEISTAGDYRAGQASLVHNVYLYFSLQGTLQRYYSGALDSVGLDTGTGMPAGQVGSVCAMVGYPGRLIASTDPGSAIYSDFAANTIESIGRANILAQHDSGWHPLFTAGFDINTDGEVAGRPNTPIRNMTIQPIPGDYTDRLWFTWGPFIYWISLSLDPTKVAQKQYQAYRFKYQGYLITSWIYANVQTVKKFWQEIKLYCESYLFNWVYIDYQVDSSTSWELLGNVSFSPSFGSVLEAVGKDIEDEGYRIRFRFRFNGRVTTDNSRIKYYLLDSLVRVPVNRTTTIQFRAADYDHDLRGNPEGDTLDTKLNLLEIWEASASAKLTVSALSNRLHGKKVFIEPYSLRTVTTIYEGEPGREVDVCVATLIEV